MTVRNISSDSTHISPKRKSTSECTLYGFYISLSHRYMRQTYNAGSERLRRWILLGSDSILGFTIVLQGEVIVQKIKSLSATGIEPKPRVVVSQHTADYTTAIPNVLLRLCKLNTRRHNVDYILINKI